MRAKLANSWLGAQGLVGFSSAGNAGQTGEHRFKFLSNVHVVQRTTEYARHVPLNMFKSSVK